MHPSLQSPVTPPTPQSRRAHGSRRALFAAAGAVGACVLVSGPTLVMAEEATDSTASSSPVAEIVVTAQHRAENVQKTPITLSVYTDQTLKTSGITDMADLATIAPDIGFANVQGDPIITVRGISSRDTTESGDPAVSVNTDGFYINRPYGLDAAMYDIARVEVLHGPQGTLNGRNSVGGSINIITAKPTKSFGAYASLEYGNFNDLIFQGMVNVPVNDELQVRAAFQAASHDGYRDNAPQPNGDDQDTKSGRVEIAFQPFENFRGLITGQYTKEGGAGDVSENIPFIYTSTGALDHNLPPGINSQTFSVGTEPVLDLKEKTIRFDFRYDVGGIEFTVLGGWDSIGFYHASDDTNPYSSPSVFAFAGYEDSDTVNTEFRVASNRPGRFQWQAGFFFFAEDSHLVSADSAPLASGGYDQFFGFVYSPRSRSEAGYVQASYQVTDALKLTAGARFTSDSKAEFGYYGDLTANIVYQNESGGSSSSKPTFGVAIDYALTGKNLLYAKFDTGYKAGGFNFGGGAYTPETVTAYEIGSKNRFLDDTVQLNLAAFYDDYTDQQVSTFAYLANGSPVALTENAGASRIYGVEGELIAQLSSVGTLDISVNYLHARYTNFLSAADPSDPSVSGNVQLAGNTLPQAPTWSFLLGFEHKWDVLGGVLTGRIQSKAQTSSNFSFYNFADSKQNPYTVSDAFLSYAPGSGHWKVTGFVKNLENSVVYTNAQENQYAYSYTYQFAPPRTYGLRVEYSW